MEPDYDEIIIEVDESEWDTSNDTTSTDLSEGSWIGRLLRTNDRVYRVNICVAEATPKVVSRVKQILVGSGFGLLRFDTEEKVSCFLTAIIRSSNQLIVALKALQGLLSDITPPMNFNITYSDVTFSEKGWMAFS